MVMKMNYQRMDFAPQTKAVENQPFLMLKGMKRALMTAGATAAAVGLAEYFGIDTKPIRYVVDAVGPVAPPLIAALPAYWFARK